jgi:hypothetical protein
LISVLSEAISLAKEGYFIFPVHISRRIHTTGPEDVFHCTCGTINCNGKHPSVNSFSSESTSDITRISNYNGRWENRGIGIHLRKSYCWVVDVDAPEGLYELKQILDSNGSLPNTRVVVTGGGGLHYYFAGWIDKINSGKLADHIDIKGNVGDAYVVAPPTLHSSGSRYGYINRCNPSDAPDWLVDLVVSKTYRRMNAVRLSQSSKDSRVGYEIPIELLLSSTQLSNLKPCGDMLRGDHPQHGSKNHRNFTIDKSINRWFCNRCESYGGLFELAAILGGIANCEDFKRNSNDIGIPSLQGKKFVKAVQYCLDSGIDPEDIKIHLSRGKYVRR